MKRLIAGVVGTALMSVGLISFAPISSAATSGWAFASASFSLSDAMGSQTASVSVQNLRINADGTIAYNGGTVLRAPNGSCQTYEKDGSSIRFTTGAFAPCDGLLNFSVSASGQLQLTGSSVRGFGNIWTGAVAATSANQGSQWPPVISCSAILDGSDAATVKFTDPGTGATSYTASSQPVLPAAATQSVNGDTIAIKGLNPGTSYVFTVSGSGSNAGPGTCNGTVTTPALPTPPVGSVTYGAITGATAATAEQEWTLSVASAVPAGWSLAWKTSTATITAHGSNACASVGTSAIVAPFWERPGQLSIKGNDVQLAVPCKVNAPTLDASSSHINGIAVTINYSHNIAANGVQLFATYTVLGSKESAPISIPEPPANGVQGSATFDIPSLKPGVDVRVRLTAVNGPLKAVDAWKIIKAEAVKPAFTLSYGATDINATVGTSFSDAATVIPAGSVDKFTLGGSNTIAGKLPAGLSLNEQSGLISGTLTVPVNNLQIAIVGTQTSTGKIATSILKFNVVGASVVTNTAADSYSNVSNAPIGIALSVLPQSGTQKPYSLDAASTALGIKIDANTGEITWTPSAPIGLRTVQVSSTVNGKVTALAPFTINVVNAPATAQKPVASNAAASSAGSVTGGAGSSSGAAGATGAYSDCLAPNGTIYIDAHGSVGSTLTIAPNILGMPVPKSFVVTKGSLPVGVALDGTYGVISGTPVNSNGGVGGVEITTVWPDGTARATDFNIAVDDPHHALNYPNRIIGSIGQSITVTPLKVNSSGTTKFSVVCGKVPAGVTFNASTGVLTGTPTQLDERPTPIRVRMSDDFGWVESSFIFVVNSGVTQWLRYADFAQIGTGQSVAIVPTRSGLPATDSYALSGAIPKGLKFNKSTGVLSGRALVSNGVVYSPTVTALGADRKPQTTTVVRVKVVKPGVPMKVNGRVQSSPLKVSSSVVVTKTTHPAYSRLDAYVTCKGCTFNFDRKLGKLTVKTGKSTTTVTATIVAAPVGSKAKALYADHAWSRTWQAAGK